MNREEVIKLARECGFPDWWMNPPEPERQNGEAISMLERLIHLATEKAVEEERERFDSIVRDVCESYRGSEWGMAAEKIGDAIRPRKGNI